MSCKVFHYPEQVAFGLSFNLRKHFLLKIRKLSSPLVGGPAPEFFKFFQMFCQRRIRLESCGCIEGFCDHAGDLIADLAKNAAHESLKLRMTGSGLGNS